MPGLPPLSRRLAWLPFGAGLAAFALAVSSGVLELGVGMAAGAGLIWAAWLWAKELRVQALGFLLLLSPLAWDAWIAAPRLERELRAAPPGGYLRVSGIVRDWSREPSGLRYRLGEATLRFPAGAAGEAERRVAELEIAGLPGQPDYGVRRRLLRVGGRLIAAERRNSRLVLQLGHAAWHVEADPIARNGEWLRRRLADRAGYYLPHRTLAVYLPVVLGVRDNESPEARRVTAAFNRVGVAHLFAISGLHVGLIYLLLLGVARLLTGLAIRRQGWVHQRTAARAVVALLVWLYIGLIGFPAPAVRAAAMGSMIVWTQLWGTRTSPFYLLVLAAALMLAWEPSLIHDLSFQLSFLSYACLMAAGALWSLRPPPEEHGTWAARLIGGSLLSLLVTLCITLGLWPLLSSVFERLSLLVFAGNLLLVPLMSVAILPAGLIAFGASLIALGSPPEHPVERLAFAALERVLSGWVSLVEILDRAGAALVFRYRIEWTPGAWLLYYAALAGLFLAVRGWLRRRRAEPAGALRPPIGA